jgi:cytochrome b subunit of formate dehydrogenase
MFKRILLALIVYIIVVVVCSVWIHNVQSNLFITASWILIVPAVAGLFAGLLWGKLKGKQKASIKDGKVERHSVSSVLEHWGNAIGFFLLIVSGFMLGFGFISGRMTSGGLYPKNLHFLGLILTLFCSCYFLGNFLSSREHRELMPGIKDIIDGTIRKYLLRFRWKDLAKYTSSQKSAFLAFVVLGAGVFITGGIKIAADVWQISLETVQRATYAHDIFSILFMALLLIHTLIVILVRSNWRLLASLFTGKMSEDHVKKEKPVWYRELTE